MGICLACRKGSGCDGHRYRNECREFVPKEPTRPEWQELYTRMLERLAETKEYYELYKVKGQAHAMRRAMIEYHGFCESEIRLIEESVDGLGTEEKRILRWEL